MKKTLFLTGYPGFLASKLIEQLIEDDRDSIDHIYVLVLTEEKAKAEEKVNYYTKTAQVSRNLFTIVPGDITKESLEIEDLILEKLRNNVTHVFHLAAIYDLAVPKRLAEAVNITGTSRVNDWVQTLPHVKRYIYFSTAYVSGKREGRIYEDELVEGQAFRNHYEQTKYEAEVLVEQLKTIVPTTIIRPGVVKGDSKTGETIKFDGLYFMLNFYDKLRLSPFLPYMIDGAPPEGNFVPSDYVLQAASFLAMNPIGEGKTYHLTDPDPYDTIALQRMLAEHLLGRTPKGTIPVSLVKLMLSVAPIRKWLQVEKEALDYFTYESSYDTSVAKTDLKESNIVCPDLVTTLQPMISYYRKYKDDSDKQIEIS